MVTLEDGAEVGTTDILSQVAEAFRLRGSMSGAFGVSAPWGYAMPKTDHVGLLVVTRGRVHFELEAEERVTLDLAPGDVVGMPHGHAYALRDAPGTALRPFSEMAACSGVRVEPRPVGQTEMIGLCCELSGGRTNPMLRVLPPVIYCPGDDGRVSRWLEPSVRLLATESVSRTPGRTTILNRLAEVVFIQIIRSWLERVPLGEGGWLRALTDPQLGPALEALHAEPGRPWNLAELAAQARMSRSAFAARFRSLVGDTPLEYLTRLRMQRAAMRLEHDEAPLKEIVATSGYASEAAFRTAFRRWMGESPGTYRRRASVS